LEAAEMHNPKLVVNRIRPQMVKKGDMMDIDDMIDILAIDLLGVVPEDEHIVVSTNRGEPAICNEQSRASQAYRNIVRRILGENVPLMSLEFEVGLVDRLKKFFGL
ncbi:MAG TPA: septum site-determining protein MinD, partial [Firmicutes bacterium]|nr:septum site-determining protein MinD [Bacillota bacterium]